MGARFWWVSSPSSVWEKANGATFADVGTAMTGCRAGSLVVSFGTFARTRRRVAPVLGAFVIALAFGGSARAVMVVDATDGLITHPGGGFGGANALRLQNVAFTLSSLGHFASDEQGLRIAEDFTITQPAIIQSVTVFAYQPGSTTTSTFETLRFSIWNGSPAFPGSAVVFGDAATNRYTTSTFTGVYRDSEAFPGGNNRPIMSVTASGLALALAPGTYWLDFDTGGTLGAGPFVPGLAKLGLSSLPGANALAWSDSTDAWSALDDASPGVQPVAVGMQLTGVMAPTVVTGAPSGLTVSGADLNGTVTPGDAETTYSFEYGETTAYGATTGPSVLAAGAIPVPVRVPVTGLVPGRGYHARLIARNSAGVTVGPDIGFATPPKLTLGRLKVHPAHVRTGRVAALRFALSGAARVTVVVDRIAPGRRRAGTCRPTSRTGPRCTAFVRRGAITVTRPGGAVTTISIPARLGGRTLAPGRYRISVIAKDAATRRVSNTRRVVLTVRL